MSKEKDTKRKAIDELKRLAYEYRMDWSDFDGRILRDELYVVIKMLEEVSP